MSYDGTDCETVSDPGTSYTSTLENRGGNTAAISNLQFCLVETTFPLCPLYGTSRDDPTAIFAIRNDPDSDAIEETQVGDIPDLSSNSDYPIGLAFDPDNEVWYFAEAGGILKIMNEGGSLTIREYEGISSGSDIAGATYHDGGYYFTPQGGDTLSRAEPDGDDVIVNDVCDLPLSGLTFGDIAIDHDEAIAYFSVSGAFFKVDLDDCSSEVIVESDDRETYAVLSQIAFAEGTLWAHHAGTGDWRTVNLETGELSELVDTTREYTDLAQCGQTEHLDSE